MNHPRRSRPKSSPRRRPVTTRRWPAQTNGGTTMRTRSQHSFTVQIRSTGHWPLATLQSAMNMHLEQTLDEATHQLKGDYATSLKDYDRVVQHILGMADGVSDDRP